MDQYNVIVPTYNLSELENNMFQWLSMPYERRLRSDENCIRIYGMSNTELFNKLKAFILSNASFDDSKEILIGKAISEGTLITPEKSDMFNVYSEDEQNFIWKKQIAEQLEESPLIVIISPTLKEDEMTIEELNAKYNRYLALSEKNKRFSNSYSLDLWGYNVPNMFEIMKGKLQISGEDDYDNLLAGNNSLKRSNLTMKLVKEKCDRMIVENDKVGLFLTKLDCYSDKMSNYDKFMYNKLSSSIDDAINDYDYSEAIPTFTPYFTPGEMEQICPGEILNDVDPADYFKTVKELMQKYENCNNDEEKSQLENSILSLGWNPSVSLTDNNIKFARNRQLNWLKEHAVNIVDVTKLKFPSIITESSNMMKKLYKENKLYPVYIVISFSDTLFGKVINKIKKSEYSHAGISLDSNLQQIMTFKFHLESKINGFFVENLDDYINNSKEAKIIVLSLFVDEKTKFKLESVFKEFLQKQEKTRYGFGNLFRILFSKEYNNPENLSLVCSQFVDTVLKLANINLTDKSSNLVIPQDFVQVSKHPKVFKVYEGLAIEYNEKNIENIIYNLFKTNPTSEIKYNNLLPTLSESFSLSYYTENEKANIALNELRELLTPEAVVFERKLPVKFTDKGDLSISLFKSLEQEYQEAHKLLKTYSDENTVAIKHELARLFLINITIEKKIKNMKKDDSDYKSLVDLRARVLNDFKKYLKIVLSKEPEFNFGDYFKSSEYYDNSIEIDNSTLKFLGSLIKKFVKKK